MSTAVYGAGDGSVVQVALAHTTAASFGQRRPILGVFGGGMAQKRLDTNMRLCGQVVLSFELQPPAPMYHR